MTRYARQSDYDQLLLDNIDSDYPNPDQLPPGKLLVSVFMAEYGWHLHNPRGKQPAQICTEYLQGLPSIVTLPFTNSDILQWMAQVRGDYVPTASEGLHIDAYWRKVGYALHRLLQRKGEPV